MRGEEKEEERTEREKDRDKEKRGREKTDRDKRDLGGGGREIDVHHAARQYWYTHTTHVKESYHTCERVMSQIRIGVPK